MRNLQGKCEILSVERGSTKAVNFTLENGDRRGATKVLPSECTGEFGVDWVEQKVTWER